MNIYAIRLTSVASALIAGSSFGPTPSDATFFSCDPIIQNARIIRENCRTDCLFVAPDAYNNCNMSCEEYYRNKNVEYIKCGLNPGAYYNPLFGDYLDEVREYQHEWAERAIECGNPFPFEVE